MSLGWSDTLVSVVGVGRFGSRHRKTGAGFCASALAADLRSPPTQSIHDLAEQIHWSECGRATSVASADALGRPHRSVLAFAMKRHLLLLLARFGVLAFGGTS